MADGVQYGIMNIKVKDNEWSGAFLCFYWYGYRAPCEIITFTVSLANKLLSFARCSLSYHCGGTVLVWFAVENHWEGGMDAEEKMFFKSISFMRE